MIYAILNNNIVTSILESSDEEELFPIMKNNQLVIDITDEYPLPEIGWELVGNELVGQPSELSWKITRLAMRRRFTNEELIALYAAAASNTVFKILLDNLAVSTYVDLSNEQTLSLGDTGIKSNSLLFVTEQLQNSFRLSGSTAAEATAAVIQLSQGLASGQLRGQELRSVLEQNAVIGGLLAEQLGTTRGNLLKLAEAGKITSDVFLKALLSGSTKINKDVEKLGVTFSEATQKGINKFTIALGELNKEFGLSKIFDKAITSIVDNLKTLGAVLIGVATAAIPFFITQLKLLASALIANPLTGILIALTSAIAFSILEFDRFSAIVLKTSANIRLFFAELDVAIQSLGAKTKGFLGLESLQKDQEGFIEVTKKNIEAIKDEIKQIDEATAQFEKGRDPFATFETESFEKRLAKTRKELEKLFAGNKGTTSPLKKQLEELNSSFNNGEIPVLQYNKRLLELTRLMSNKKGPIALNADLAKVLRENVNREFEYGIINVETFNEKVNNLKIDELNQKLNSGRITLAEYNKELLEVSKKFEPGAAIYTGINNYIRVLVYGGIPNL